MSHSAVSQCSPGVSPLISSLGHVPLAQMSTFFGWLVALTVIGLLFCALIWIDAVNDGAWRASTSPR